MMMSMINREQAWELLCEFTKTEGLRKHAMAVETCVSAYARKFGEDEHKWSITALLHDFDWEIHPQVPDHPTKGESILAERGVETKRLMVSGLGGEDPFVDNRSAAGRAKNNRVEIVFLYH